VATKRARLSMDQMKNPQKKKYRPMLLCADPSYVHRGSILSILQGSTPHHNTTTEEHVTKVEVVVVVSTAGNATPSAIDGLVRPEVVAAEITIDVGVTAGAEEGVADKVIKIALVVLVCSEGWVPPFSKL